jgi:photosystem II stability/assembly factor-like uncharacterized protein
MPAVSRFLRRFGAMQVATFAAALAAAGVLALSGCSDDEETPVGPAPAYRSIVIAGPDTVRIGQTITLTATVIDTAGQTVAAPQLTWSSSATGIATVNGGGGVTGKSEGLALITATGGGATSNAESVYVFPGYGWVDQSGAANTLNNLHGVFFLDERNGWAVGDLGTILHTTDGGASWSPQTSNSTGYRLNGVAFVSPTSGYVVGSAGRLLFTTNGGSTWAPMTVSTDGGKSLNAIRFQNSTHGWIVGNGGLILRTTNGGASWARVQPAVTAVDLYDVSFPRYSVGGSAPLDPYGYGWAVGATGIILKSENFGQSWSIYQPYATSDALFGVVRVSKFEAVAAGANNRVLGTVADADTALWQLQAGPAPFTNFAAVAWPADGSRPLAVWAAGTRPDMGQPAILASEDGGITWNEQALPPDAPLTGGSIDALHFIDAYRGWAVGRNGLILHTVTGGR